MRLAIQLFVRAGGFVGSKVSRDSLETRPGKKLFSERFEPTTIGMEAPVIGFGGLDPLSSHRRSKRMHVKAPLRGFKGGIDPLFKS